MPWYLHYWFKSVLLLFLLTITKQKYFSSSPKFLYNYIVFEFILFLVVQPRYSENYIAIISCTWEWASNPAFLVGGYPTRYFSSRFVWQKFIVELNEIYGCFLQKKKFSMKQLLSLHKSLLAKHQHCWSCLVVNSFFISKLHQHYANVVCVIHTKRPHVTSWHE